MVRQQRRSQKSIEGPRELTQRKVDLVAAQALQRFSATKDTQGEACARRFLLERAQQRRREKRCEVVEGRNPECPRGGRGLEVVAEADGLLRLQE